MTPEVRSRSISTLRGITRLEKFDKGEMPDGIAVAYSHLRKLRGPACNRAGAQLQIL
jgi:hypothetical protein